VEPDRHSTYPVGPRLAWFVKQDGKYFLQDEHGNKFRNLDRILIVQGSFGFDFEGQEKLPRPQIRDPLGKVLVQGDALILDFRNGDDRCPIVRGGVRSYDTGDGQLARNFENMARGYNRYKFRLYPQDETGLKLGEVRFYCCDNYKNEADWGLVDFYVSNSVDGVIETALNVQVGPVLGSHNLFFMSPSQAGFTVSGGSDPVIKQPFEDDLKTWLNGLTTFLASIAAAPPPIAAAVAAFQPIHAAFLATVNAGTHLTTVFKTE